MTGKRVLVTGAAGAFGGAAAGALRRHGARVLGLDLHPGEDVLECDLRDPAAVKHAVAETIERLGGLDVLVNNAGVGDVQDAGAEPDDRALEILEVNLLGAWRATAAAMPALLESRGRVVNVSSGLAVVNVPFASAYMASKRGIAAWSDALRLEYRGRVDVVTVYPGYVRTPIHDAARKRGLSLEGFVPAEPVEATVKAILRGCAGRPRRDIASSRGLAAAMRLARLAPGLADRLVARRARHLEIPATIQAAAAMQPEAEDVMIPPQSTSQTREAGAISGTT